MRNLTMPGFQKVMTAACVAIGLRSDAVKINGSSLIIPTENIVIAPELSGDSRVWRVTTTFKISSIDGINEREVTNILFEEPLQDFLTVSKRVALYLAGRKIDIAIENGL